MYLCREIILVFLLPIAWSAKILVTAPFAGSHLTSIWDIAVVLADNGHDVTFISLEKGSLDNFKHPKITGYIMKETFWEKGVFKKIMNDLCTVPASLEFSEHMLENTAKQRGCVDAWSQAYAKSAKAYRSTEFENIVDAGKFDILIAESAEFMFLTAIAASRKIPTICYVPSLFNLPAIMHGNYPLLASSHPGLIHDENLGEKPSFNRRLRKILGLPLVVAFFTAPKKFLQPNLDKYGVTEEEATSTTQLFLINDHPAFTFPNYAPPFVVNVGAMKYLDYAPKSLPAALQQFIDSNSDPLVYMSFGTYLEPNYKWTQTLFEAMGKMKVKVVLKLTNKSVSLPENFLAMGWVPQVDLLASGKVDLFISHCGNNGRIELSYYNVPVLCVPLFADQLLDSEIIKYKKFGQSLLRHEIVDEASVASKVRDMLERKEEFKANLEAMSYIVKNDPGRSKDKLLFYVDYLIKFGSLDYLHNHVLRKQSFWEVNNLDVFAVILGSMVIILTGILVLTCRICRTKTTHSSTKKQN